MVSWGQRIEKRKGRISDIPLHRRFCIAFLGRGVDWSDGLPHFHVESCGNQFLRSDSDPFRCANIPPSAFSMAKHCGLRERSRCRFRRIGICHAGLSWTDFHLRNGSAYEHMRASRKRRQDARSGIAGTARAATQTRNRCKARIPHRPHPLGE